MAKKSVNNKIRRNYFIVAFVFGMIVLAIFVRASLTCFVSGNNWKKLGATLVRPNVEVPAVRGNIYSSDLRLMATSESLYRLYIDFWAEGLNGDTLRKYVRPLSEDLSRMFPDKSAGYYYSHIMNGWNMKEKEADQINRGRAVTRKSREYSLLDGRVNYLQLKTIRTFPFLKQSRNKSGLYTKEYVKRTKPFGTLASRTIGDIYGEFEKGGKNGLELEYDSLLKGVPGVSMMKKAYGRITSEPVIYPINGKDIITTIDIDIQDITEKALMSKLREIDAESGTAVVMEVNTGEIKAITNMGRAGEGMWAETKNHAVADEIEPGSTFKVASMMVALEDGIINPDDTIDVGNGLFQYAGAVVRDHNWDKGGYHRISAAQAIWFSSNVGVAKIILKGYEQNPEKYVEGLYKLGITEPLDLEIPGAGRAKIRSPKDKSSYWSKTTLPWMSFGYETQIPPIYTLTFFNAIANNGKMISPFFVKEIQSDGKTESRKKTRTINSQICSNKTLKIIQEMLLGVVESGTGSAVKSEFVSIAGKTGTAQISQGAAGYKGAGLSHQVSFCGYFPADKPKYSAIVVVRKPRNGYPSGGGMSGGVFKIIAEEVYAHIHKEPQDCPKDTINPITPRTKSGFYEYTEYMLDKLDISYKDSMDSKKNLVSANLDDDKLVLKDRKVIDNLVPNVSGMGAKDAVFILENMGLRVNLSGKGAVFAQSITPGAKIVRGQTISIQLK